MQTTRYPMNPWEHCPECGTLLVTVPGGALCPYCGFEQEDFEERPALVLARLPGRFGEGVRFHLMDEAA
jgi:hypothetical protein